MVQERVETTPQDPQQSGSFPPSSSGGVLVEREQTKRLSWPLLILLFLLLAIFFWLYLFGPGGRFGESLSSDTDYSFAPVELVSPKPTTRPQADPDSDEPVTIVPPGGFETGDGHALGAPGTKGGQIILAPDPTTPAPPETTLTQAERDFEPNLMMGLNRVQQAIDYIKRAAEDGPESAVALAARNRDVVDFNRNLQPVGRWVPIYQGYLPTIDLLGSSIDRIVADGGANAVSLMDSVQTSLDAARVPMDRLVDGSSTY